MQNKENNVECVPRTLKHIRVLKTTHFVSILYHIANIKNKSIGVDWYKSCKRELHPMK